MSREEFVSNLLHFMKHCPYIIGQEYTLEHFGSYDKVIDPMTGESFQDKSIAMVLTFRGINHEARMCWRAKNETKILMMQPFESVPK